MTEINDEIITLLDDLYDTMVEYDGVGIAAPQIDVGLRVAIVELGEERDILEMINPTVVETDGAEVDIEGCLSFRGYMEKWNVLVMSKLKHVIVKDVFMN